MTSIVPTTRDESYDAEIMTAEEREKFCELLVEELVETYGLDESSAMEAVEGSAIQKCLKEIDAAFLDHYPMRVHAEIVYWEMFDPDGEEPVW